MAKRAAKLPRPQLVPSGRPLRTLLELRSSYEATALHVQCLASPRAATGLAMGLAILASGGGAAQGANRKGGKKARIEVKTLKTSVEEEKSVLKNQRGRRWYQNQ